MKKMAELVQKHALCVTVVMGAWSAVLTQAELPALATLAQLWEQAVSSKDGGCALPLRHVMWEFDTFLM